MNKKLFVIIIFSLSIFISCRKDLTISQKDMVGNWVWKYGYSSTGWEMLPGDSTNNLTLQFKPGNTFINQAITVIGGPTAGFYQLQLGNNKSLLILNSDNTSPDTFQISIEGNKMILSETNNDYTWNYSFSKN